MAANDEIRIGLAIESDSAGAAQAQKQLADIKKRIEALKGEFNSGAKNVDAFTRELSDLEKQARKLDTALDAVGERRRIDIDTGNLVDPAEVSAGTGLRRAGRELRNLPSMPIPGTGLATDAIGNLTRLSGALVDVTENSKVAAIAANVLTPALGAQTAATVAAYAPIALLVAGLAAIGVAIKALVDSTSQNAERINSFAETQRDINTRIAEGLTSTDAQEELDRLTEAQERNRATLAALQGAYDQAQEELGVLGGVARVVSGDEEALANQITETNKTITEQQAEMDALARALNDGSLAANDAAEAERKLAEERTQGLLTDAAQANELAQLRERAAELTQEQIDTELESLDRRRIGVEAELAVLEASGNTSEEVAKKIAQLRDQLQHLGAQAEVLRNTTPRAEASDGKAAKEAQREQERAAKDAQRSLESAAKAQQTYSDKVRDAGRRFKDAVQDINRGLSDNLADNLLAYQDDIGEGAIAFNQEQLKDEREFQRDLAKIRADAGRDELDASRARDFAALRDLRERTAIALRERGQEEADENAEQIIEQRQHLDELARDRQRADRDAQTDAQRAYRDARIDRTRALRDARQDLNDYHRDRSAQEQTFMRSSLNNWQQYFQQVARLQGFTTEGTSNRRNSGSGNSTPSFDDMQYVFGAA